MFPFAAAEKKNGIYVEMVRHIDDFGVTFIYTKTDKFTVQHTRVFKGKSYFEKLWLGFCTFVYLRILSTCTEHLLCHIYTF